MRKEHWAVEEWPAFETFDRYYSEVPYDVYTESFYFELLNKWFREKYPRNRRILDYKMSCTPDRRESGPSSLLKRMEHACHTQFERQNTDVGGVQGSGLTLLRSAFAYDKKRPVSSDNQPMLHILSSCRNTIHQCKNLSWKNSAELDGFGTSEAFDKKHFDAPRALMSILAHRSGRPLIVTPEEAKSQERRKIMDAEFALMAPHHPNWRSHSHV